MAHLQWAGQAWEMEQEQEAEQLQAKRAQAQAEYPLQHYLLMVRQTGLKRCLKPAERLQSGSRPRELHHYPVQRRHLGLESHLGLTGKNDVPLPTRAC